MQSSLTISASPATQSFTYDAASQGIASTQSFGGSSWTDNWYRMGGTNMWHYSNRNGFDAQRGDGAASAYKVRGGDTLRSVAQAVWGDADLWYKLAEANGLTATSSLSEGQSLTIPTGVWRTHESASTYIPYDAQRFLSLTDPSPAYPAPAPVKADKGCGGFGAILLVVIAVAVAVVLPELIPALAPSALGGGVGGAVVSGAIGAATGSVVSQAVGVATGIQDKFSFKDVALAAIAGGVGGGVGSIGGLGKATSLIGKIEQGIARGTIGNVVTQGASIATGLQTKFDWVGVAVGGIVGGVTAGLGKALKLAPIAGEGGNRSVGNIGATLATGAAAAIVGASARSLITGTDFGDNVIAALPDVIGSTIGNLVATGIAGKGVPRAGKPGTPPFRGGNQATSLADPGALISVGPLDPSSLTRTLPNLTTNAQVKAAVNGASRTVVTPALLVDANADGTRTYANATGAWNGDDLVITAKPGERALVPAGGFSMDFTSLTGASVAQVMANGARQLQPLQRSRFFNDLSARMAQIDGNRSVFKPPRGEPGEAGARVGIALMAAAENAPQIRTNLTAKYHEVRTNGVTWQEAGNIGLAAIAAMAPLGSKRAGERSPVAPIHKNSLKYVGDTHVYVIRGPDGSLFKVGESAQGVRVGDGSSIRAEQQARALLRETGDRYPTQIRQTFGGKTDARAYETKFIQTYERLYGKRPLGNPFDR